LAIGNEQLVIKWQWVGCRILWQKGCGVGFLVAGSYALKRISKQISPGQY
jgi:hypothetical protein